MKIERPDYEAAYEYGRLVFAKAMRVTDAISALEKIGLNQASATFYIYNLRQMLNGTLYQRAMSVQSTDDFLAWIRRDYGPSALRNAVASLEKHIPYFRKSSPSPMRGHVKLLE